MNDIQLKKINNGYMVKIGWTDDQVWTFRKYEEAVEFISTYGKRLLDDQGNLAEDLKDIIR